jgi:hypothetical protein
MAGVLVVMGRTKVFAPPAWRMLQLLREEPDRWLTLEQGERPPAEVEGAPDSVRWSSLWPDRPQDEILIEVTQDGLGSRLRWTLLCPEGDRPGDELIRERRHRLNLVLNEELWDFVDSQG